MEAEGGGSPRPPVAPSPDPLGLQIVLVQKLLGRNSSRPHVCFASGWRPPGGRSLPVCELQLPRLLRWRRDAWSRAGQTFQGGEGCATRKWGLGSGISYFSWAPPTPQHDLPGEWAPGSRAGWSCSLALRVGLPSRRHGHCTAQGSGPGPGGITGHSCHMTSSSRTAGPRGPSGDLLGLRHEADSSASSESDLFLPFSLVSLHYLEVRGLAECHR